MAYIDLNPHISVLDDPATKRKVAEMAERALETVDHQKQHPLGVDQIERERFQAESNHLAEANPRYAAARAASSNFLVVPLDGRKPFVGEASRSDHQLFAWWTEYPDANPGVLLGRIGGTFALRVEDDAAYMRLREMAKVVHPAVEDGRDSVKGFIEYRDLGGYYVRLLLPTQPVSIRTQTGWSRGFTQAVYERERQRRQEEPQTYLLVFSYPSVMSGMDAFDYKRRTIAAGVELLGEGDVLPWSGSILEGGIQVAAPTSRPPEVPLWLAKVIGKPRSRKAMDAAREQYERDLTTMGHTPIEGLLRFEGHTTGSYHCGKQMV
jgi:hypothetical protein